MSDHCDEWVRINGGGAATCQLIMAHAGPHEMTSRVHREDSFMLRAVITWTREKYLQPVKVSDP